MRWLLAGAFLLLAYPLLFGQSIGITQGTLAGDVKDDSSGPLPGASITLTGDDGIKTAIADGSGSFIFPYLTPGTYTVKAELEGFAAIEQNEVYVLLGRRTEISFTLKAKVQETVIVTGSPMIDLTSSTAGTIISRELTEAIPVGRSIASVIGLAPGVSDGGITGGNLSISGASGLENTYIIDGVNITDPGFGAVGAYSARYGSLGSGFPPDMINEVQVKTGGFEPEYGEALGGVVNVITRSGGNDFHGDAYTYFTPGSLEGDRELLDRDQSLIVNTGEVRSIDAGFDLGGAIAKDKVFFFGAYNPKSVRATFLNDPAATSFQDFPESTNARLTQSYSMKVSANLSSNYTLEFSAFGDPSMSGDENQSGRGLTSSVPLKRRSNLNYGSNSQVGRFTGILNPNMFLEVQVARAHNEFTETPSAGLDEHLVVDFTGPVPAVSGGLGDFEGSSGTNAQYSLKLTNIWKAHVIRYGVQFEDIDYVNGVNLSGPTFTAFNGQQTTTGAQVLVFNGSDFGLPVGVVYEAIASMSPVLAPSNSRYLNWFAQDSWNPVPYLNLQYGVRWEQQHLQGELEGATQATFGNNWAPRIGATYDYMRNGRSKAFVHYGRYFERIPNFMASAAFNTTVQLDGLYFDPALTQPVPDFGFIFGTGNNRVEGQGDFSSPLRTRAQYSNEWTAGVEQEVAANFSVGARVIFRNVQNVVEDIQVNLDAPCVPVADGRCVPAGMTAEDFLNQPNSEHFFTNVDGHYPGFPALVRNYKALEITAEKRFSENWQVLGSYQYAQLEGNYEGLFLRDSFESTPNWTSLADFAQSPFLEFTYAPGPLPNDIRHMLKLFASRMWKMGLNTGIALNLQSGRPITKLGVVPIYGSIRLLTPRGALGRTESLFTLDLHADYAFHFGAADRRVTVGVDIFNLLNSQNVVSVVQQSEIPNGRNQPLPNRDFLKPARYQDPRSIRFLVRYSF